MSSRSRLAALAALALAAGGLAGVGCGGSDETEAGTGGFVTGVTTPDYLRTSTGPYETTVQGSATVIRTDAQGNPIAKTTTTTATSKSGSGSAGDEEGIRVPAAFAVQDGAVSPASIAVPPTLPIELRIRSADGRSHELVFSTAPEVTVRVGPTGQVVRRVPGQRKGQYTVRVDGGPARPALLAVDNAGP